MVVFIPPKGRPAVMGVLNVTPDSFSDGGRFTDPERAVDHGLAMMEEGADIVDVGGESTRPGASPVEPSEELERVLPVVQGLVELGVPVSIDTRRASVALRCLDAGACMVNDVSALADPAMTPVCARVGCWVCLMHMKGTPETMQQNPTYGDVVSEVRDFLIARALQAIKGGIEARNIYIDPGIGFGKTTQHNLALIESIGKLAATGYPVMIGVSRKSFIGKLLGAEDAPLPASDRLEGGLALQVVAQLRGAAMIRTHDPLATRRCVQVLSAL